MEYACTTKIDYQTLYKYLGKLFISEQEPLTVILFPPFSNSLLFAAIGLFPIGLFATVGLLACAGELCELDLVHFRLSTSILLLRPLNHPQSFIGIAL